ncbi:MAG: hypothetical protein K0R94_1411 [Burkholderiales bacterium]|jgi:hypothetical protein|nr:hypothetical protein [Burkholderiales bacterium]
MNKLILLCGLLSGLYASVQAEETQGWYARATCQASDTHHDAGHWAQSFIGFGYADNENEAKVAAKESCTANVSSGYNLYEGGKFEFKTKQGKPGLFVCGEVSYDIGLGNTEQAAITDLQTILNKNYNETGVNVTGNVYCYSSNSGMSTSGTAEFRGYITQSSQQSTSIRSLNSNLNRNSQRLK